MLKTVIDACYKYVVSTNLQYNDEKTNRRELATMADALLRGQKMLHLKPTYCARIRLIALAEILFCLSEDQILSRETLAQVDRLYISSRKSFEATRATHSIVQHWFTM